MERNSLVFTKIEGTARRVYRLQMDLKKGILIRRWGRIGSFNLKSKVEKFGTTEELKLAFQKEQERRVKRGYKLSGTEHWFQPGLILAR